MKTKQKTTKNKTSSNRDEMTQPTQRCRVPGVPSTFGKEQGNTANKEQMLQHSKQQSLGVATRKTASATFRWIP